MNAQASKRLAALAAIVGSLVLVPAALGGSSGACPDGARHGCPGAGPKAPEAERTKVRPLPASAKGPRGGEMWRSGKWLME
jgi:hypothetical protein